MSRVQEDIAHTIQKDELFMPLKDSAILVTGATGLIGSALLKTLHAANEKYGLGIRLTGQIRDSEKAKKIFGNLFEKTNFVNKSCGQYDYIVHTVSPTTSRFFIEHPVETIQTSVGTTGEILEVARACGASVVYLSSMEQYGIPYGEEQRMAEEKIGIIDHLNVRSSYSESKRLCECLCVSYASEYGVNVKIARLAQTFGAGIPLTDNRMPMQFARAAQEERDIILHTEGKSVSNFVYLTDAICGILTILLWGEKGEAYNICNDEETRTVREIAELVCSKVCGQRIQVRVEKKENMGYAPDVVMYLVSDKLRALHWNPEVGMEEAYRRMVEYLEEECK